MSQPSHLPAVHELPQREAFGSLEVARYPESLWGEEFGRPSVC